MMLWRWKQLNEMLFNLLEKKWREEIFLAQCHRLKEFPEKIF